MNENLLFTVGYSKYASNSKATGDNGRQKPRLRNLPNKRAN